MSNPAIDRTNYNALVDDDGTNTVGTDWSKNQVKICVLDPIDALLQSIASGQSTPANPTGTTDTTGKMMGLAGAITPAYSGRVLLIISGTISNNTASDGAKVQARYGTGGAPANGAAPTGTAVGGFVQFTLPATGGLKVPFSLNAVITGLTLATAYWLDVALAAITGGTATITDVSISAHEF